MDNLEKHNFTETGGIHAETDVPRNGVEKKIQASYSAELGKM